MIVASCPECQKSLKVKDELAGKRVKCPACGTPFVVPEPPDELETIDESPPPPSSRKESATANLAADNDPSDVELGEVETVEPGENTPKRTKRKVKSSKPKSNLPLILGVVALLGLLFCCCPTTGIAIWFLGVHEPSKPSLKLAENNAGSGGSANIPTNPNRNDPPFAFMRPTQPKAGADPGPNRDLIVGKWVLDSTILTFTKDGVFEVDLGHTYKGTYQFVDRNIIECRATEKSDSMYDGRFQIEVNETTLLKETPEFFRAAQPMKRITSDPEKTAASRAKVIGKWTSVGGPAASQSTLTFGADGSMAIDEFPKPLKGTFEFVDATMVYIYEPPPIAPTSKKGLWRVVVEGNMLRFSRWESPTQNAVSFKKAP